MENAKNIMYTFADLVKDDMESESGNIESDL
eukprot:CAMPEP_0204821326 /NCGR_PEP_ID=MMETSP1018-20131115/7681_1 /ASSEMBLY_ACC=CAM_ASM_000518 /TAXON_ID=46462 /ORGANISM="Anophryoides haemophila, Strain AH6" /LENGTH=30 /DNA_ID= /DNA_START= /DNA_END= /DNA_ORIENTATION=